MKNKSKMCAILKTKIKMGRGVRATASAHGRGMAAVPGGTWRTFPAYVCTNIEKS